MLKTVSVQESGQKLSLESVLIGYQDTEKATGDENPGKYSLGLALRVYDVLQEMADTNSSGNIKRVGTSIAIGYRPEHYKQARPMDTDYFETRRCSIYDSDIADHIIRSTRYDGGIVIDIHGNIIRAGVKFVADDGEVLDEMDIPNEKSLSERFGYNEKVGSRHTSCSAVSYKMPDTLIFILSEEKNKIRVLRRGYIINSQHTEEIVACSEEDTTHHFPASSTLPANENRVDAA
ncbi:hypothetical protein ACFL96_04570 [Thermoproteota archaeon]